MKFTKKAAAALKKSKRGVVATTQVLVSDASGNGTLLSRHVTLRPLASAQRSRAAMPPLTRRGPGIMPGPRERRYREEWFACYPARAGFILRPSEPVAFAIVRAARVDLTIVRASTRHPPRTQLH